MDLFVLLSLILDITLDDLLVGILTHGVHVETTRPEVSAPEHLFDLGVMFKDVFRGETFCNLNDF